MEIGDLVTYTNGTFNSVLRVAKKVNDKTFGAVHAHDDGTCMVFEKDGEFPYGGNYPWIEILRQKKDGTWMAGKDIVKLVSE